MFVSMKFVQIDSLLNNRPHRIRKRRPSNDHKTMSTANKARGEVKRRQKHKETNSI